eukprot:1154422-Pelagomonas_calceolata.AAC.3
MACKWHDHLALNMPFTLQYYKLTLEQLSCSYKAGEACTGGTGQCVSCINLLPLPFCVASKFFHAPPMTSALASSSYGGVLRALMAGGDCGGIQVALLSAFKLVENVSPATDHLEIRAVGYQFAASCVMGHIPRVLGRRMVSYRGRQDGRVTLTVTEGHRNTHYNSGALGPHTARNPPNPH